MAESKGTAFYCAKYILITAYVINIVTCVIFLIVGSLVVIKTDDVDKRTESENQVPNILQICLF